MERPYVAISDCTDLAYSYIRKAGAHVTEEDVNSMAEAIQTAMLAWFGDMKHLTPSYRPGPTQ